MTIVFSLAVAVPPALVVLSLLSPAWLVTLLPNGLLLFGSWKTAERYAAGDFDAQILEKIRRG
jgi:hypothetical protein